MKQLLLAAIAGSVLSGCAYRDINPEGAIADERNNNGYNELREVDPGTAKLVLRSVGAAYRARFSLSTALHRSRVRASRLWETWHMQGAALYIRGSQTRCSARTEPSHILCMKPSLDNKCRCVEMARGPVAQDGTIAPAVAAPWLSVSRPRNNELTQLNSCGAIVPHATWPYWTRRILTPLRRSQLRPLRGALHRTPDTVISRRIANLSESQIRTPES